MASLHDGATAFADLPLAPEGRAWDQAAARSHLARWASSDGSGDKDKIDWRKYGKGFMWYNAASPEVFESYKLPFADVIDGTAKAVLNGVKAVKSRLAGTDIPEGDKAAVKEHCHRYYKKFGKPVPKDEVDNETETLRDELLAAETLEECEEVLARLLDSHPGEITDQDAGWAALVQEADEKIDGLKRQGRVELVEQFVSPARIVDRLQDGRLRIIAAVGELDTVNKNQRYYPKDEAAQWVRQANRLAKRGSLVGYDGHPTLFGGAGRYRDVAFRWEKFMVKDNELIGQALTVPGTEAFQTGVGPCLEAGIAIEWSKRGYGRSEPCEDEKGNWTHDIIHDYVLDGVDCVGRGADKTRTISMTVEHVDGPPIQDGAPQEVTPMHNDTDKPIETPVTDTPPAKAPEPKPEPSPVPTIDTDAIVKQVLDRARTEHEANALATADAARQLVEKMFVEKALEDHKTQLLSAVPEGPARAVLTRGLATADSIAKADEVFAEVKPLAEATFHPVAGAPGFGIVTEARHAKQRADEWYFMDGTAPRPQTEREVYETLLASVPSNGKARPSPEPGMKDWADPQQVWKQVLDNYMTVHPQYFRYCTPRGLEEAQLLAEAASTTSVLGTILPNVLPMLRQLWQKLIMFDITSVQPMDRPEARVYFLTATNASGEDLSDSTYFDSTLLNRGTEGEAKPQLLPSFSYQNISAFTKACYFELSQELEEDARAVHNISLDAEMIRVGANRVATELNYGFLDILRAQAGAGSQTYGTAIPSGSNYTAQEWRNVFGLFIKKAQSYVTQKVYEVPDWMIVDPNAALVAAGMNSGGILSGNVVKYGTGLQYVGTITGGIKLYEAAWFTANTCLLGYTPPDWTRTAHVYAPYIPLFVSPRDFAADLNTTKRSLHSRQGWKVLRPNGLSTITIASGTAGTEPV